MKINREVQSNTCMTIKLCSCCYSLMLTLKNFLKNLLHWHEDGLTFIPSVIKHAKVKGKNHVLRVKEFLVLKCCSWTQLLKSYFKMNLIYSYISFYTIQRKGYVKFAFSSNCIHDVPPTWPSKHFFIACHQFKTSFTRRIQINHMSVTASTVIDSGDIAGMIRGGWHLLQQSFMNNPSLYHVSQDLASTDLVSQCKYLHHDFISSEFASSFVG